MAPAATATAAISLEAEAAFSTFPQRTHPMRLLSILNYFPVVISRVRKTLGS
jgi:hypothetical protein